MNDFANAPLEPDDPKYPFDLKVLVLYAVARFRKHVVVFAVVGAFLGLLAGAAQPNVYSVLSKLRFEPSARQVISEEAAFGVQDGDIARFRASAAVEEEMELLRDPVIYERVVEAIGAEEILRVADPRSGDGDGTSFPVKLMHGLQAGLIHIKGLDDPCPNGETDECVEAAVKKLQANTVILPIRRTNILNVRYSDSSPAKAKVVSQELLVQMRARHLEEYQATKQLETLRSQKREAFQELQQTQRELKEYQDQCGFWDLDSDKVACQEQIRAAEILLDDLEARRQLLNGQIASLETDLNIRVDGDGGEDEGRPFSSSYKKALSDRAAVEAELVELRRKEGLLVERTVQRKEKLLATITAEIEQMDPYGGDPILASLDANTDPAIAEARAMLATYKADRQGVKSQMEAVGERLDKLERRRETMAECEANYLRFRSVAEAAGAKYKRLADSEGNLASLAIMDQEERSNLTVFREARLPREKDGPQRSKPLMMGFAVGLFFGIGLAILRQLLDRRVRYRETVEGALGLPVLCTVPDLSGEVGFDMTKTKGAA